MKMEYIEVIVSDATKASNDPRTAKATSLLSQKKSPVRNRKRKASFDLFELWSNLFKRSALKMLVLYLLGFSIEVAHAETFTSFGSASNTINSSLVIPGTNLTGTTSVKFGATPARFTVNSNTQITATVPRVANSSLFITTWRTTGTNESITFPIGAQSGTDMSIDWGDGTVETGLGNNPSHNYTTAGVYTVSVSGVYDAVNFNYFNWGDDGPKKIISIEQWGTKQWRTMEFAFARCIKLQGNAADVPDLSLVSTMSGMFSSAELFNQDISNWDVSNVTNMSYMFNVATSFNQNIGSWDVSNVNNMSHMFAQAFLFNQNISSWDVSHVTNMNGMFFEVFDFNQNIGSWNVSNVTDMDNMFYRVTSLSITNYDELLMGWASQTLKPNVSFGGGFSRYCTGESARRSMIATYGWIIRDGGKNLANINLKGNGQNIVLGNSVALVVNGTDFQGVLMGTTKTLQYTIANNSATGYTLNAIGLAGSDASSFSISGINLTSPIVLAPNASVTFNVNFNPALLDEGGIKTAMVTLATTTSCLSQSFFSVKGTLLKCSAGTLTSPTPFATAGSGFTISLVNGDFNEDGFQDVAALNTDTGIAIRLGDGNGGFSGSLVIAVPGLDFSNLNFGSNVNTKFTIGVSDINGDGHLDLAVPTNNNNILLLYGDGLGAFTTTNIPLPATKESRSVIVTKLNADSIADFIVACNPYNLSGGNTSLLLLSNGLGSYTITDTGISAKNVIIEDFNKDGITDMVTVCFDYPSYFLKGNSDGTFQPKVAIANLVGFDIVAGDFDKDGNLDVAVANPAQVIDLFKGNGQGNFVFDATIYSDYNANAVKTGDINGDGNLDLISADGPNISVFEGDGVGGFPMEPVLYFVGGSPLTDVIVYDFNNDGVQDAIGSNLEFNVLLGNAGNEINLKGNGTTIVSGDTTPATADGTDFGTVIPNTPVVKTYTIQNSGTSNLSVASIALSGANVALFAVGGIALPAIIAAGGTATFTLTLNAATIGTKTASVTINNDDCNEIAYTFAVQGSASCLSPTWTGAMSTAWNTPGNWSCGVVPTLISDVTIAVATNQPALSTNVSIHTLTLEAGTTMTVPTGLNLAVTNYIHNSGTMTVANNANLIQVDDVVNTGDVIVKRNSSALKRLDYTLWSSPVASQNLLAFSPATVANRFYTYNTDTNLYNIVPSPATTNIAVGSGYLIRVPNTASDGVATAYPGEFTGVLNNGSIPVTLANNGVGMRYNAVGNPYPSPISITQFVIDNRDNITSSLYFWRKTNAAGRSAYCTLNNGTFTTNNQAQVFDPNGIIQTGQGFFVEAKDSATSLTFNNGQRVSNTAGQFFKTKQVVDNNRIWLNATNNQGEFAQMAINYTAGATNDVDEFDAKYFNDGKTALNSVLNNTDYVIQGRALPFDATDGVPLSFKATTDGTYSIAIDRVDGLFITSQEIILKDTSTGAETNLKAGPYSFAAEAGAFNSRFVLKYQKTLKVGALVFNENTVMVFKNNGVIYVNSSTIAIKKILVYDVQGRLIAQQKNVNAASGSINNLKDVRQVLIIKVVGEDNTVVSKKVIN